MRAQSGGLLEVQGLHKSYGGLRVLQDLSFCMEAGQVMGIIGPNGAGKTTLFNVLCGFEQVDRGHIYLTGQRIDRWSMVQRARAGLVRTFQHGRVFPNLTVAENLLVLYPRQRQCGAGWQRNPAVLQWLQTLLAPFGERLLPRLDDRAFSLSYANRRRLEIARAMATKPAILLLDEPSAGMNPAETAELQQYLTHLHSQGQTMIIIEHKLPLLGALADEVLVLDEGKVIAQGALEYVLAQEAVVEAWLGQVVAQILGGHDA